VSGPSYETPAELVFLRRMGADAVGMSSVPEVIAGVHMGLRVLAISCVTNVALPAEGAHAKAPSHTDVVAAAEAASQRLAALVTGVVGQLGADDTHPET
jgi:purine-nucleoside phosphorylase